MLIAVYAGSIHSEGCAVSLFFCVNGSDSSQCILSGVTPQQALIRPHSCDISVKSKFSIHEFTAGSK